MIRVLLADDHDLVRIGIKHLLESHLGFRVVGEARNGEEAIALATEYMPDVILMDVSMPKMGGLEATEKLLRISPDFKIIALSVHATGPAPTRMLEAGAAGYITKGGDPSEIVAAIRKVVRGQRYVCPEVAQSMVLEFFDAGRKPLDSLSPRELQVMLMVSQGQKVEDISQTLCVSPKTVSTYRRRLFNKLSATTDVELTHLALRYGLIEPSTNT